MNNGEELGGVGKAQNFKSAPPERRDKGDYKKKRNFLKPNKGGNPHRKRIVFR